MISATLYGRIAREPELVQPMTGRDAYVRFSMAVETGFLYSENREIQSSSIFIRAIVLHAMCGIWKPVLILTKPTSRRQVSTPY